MGISFFSDTNLILFNILTQFLQVSYLCIIINHFKKSPLVIIFFHVCYVWQCKCLKVCFESFQIFGSALLIEGFLFKYDSIFNHHIIKEVLFNNITFEGLSFTDIRQSQYSFMFATGTVLIVICGSGIFMLKTQSKCLHIIVSNTFLKGHPSFMHCYFNNQHSMPL